VTDTSPLVLSSMRELGNLASSCVLVILSFPTTFVGYALDEDAAAVIWQGPCEQYQGGGLSLALALVSCYQVCFRSL
jgi:hypothetical protein